MTATVVERLWCPSCEEWTSLVDRGVCPWCDTPLTRRRGGWRRPDTAAKHKLTDEQLRALHLLHVREGVSVRELGRRIYRRAGYRSAKSAAMGVLGGWRRLGLEARPQGEATARANVARRLPGSPGKADRAAYKRWLRSRGSAAPVGVPDEKGQQP